MDASHCATAIATSPPSTPTSHPQKRTKKDQLEGAEIVPWWPTAQCRDGGRSLTPSRTTGQERSRRQASPSSRTISSTNPAETMKSTPNDSDTTRTSTGVAASSSSSANGCSCLPGGSLSAGCSTFGVPTLDSIRSFTCSTSHTTTTSLISTTASLPHVSSSPPPSQPSGPIINSSILPPLTEASPPPPSEVPSSISAIDNATTIPPNPEATATASSIGVFSPPGPSETANPPPDNPPTETAIPTQPEEVPVPPPDTFTTNPPPITALPSSTFQPPEPSANPNTNQPEGPDSDGTGGAGASPSEPNSVPATLGSLSTGVPSDMTTITITQAFTTTYNGTLTTTFTSLIETRMPRAGVPLTNDFAHDIGAIVGVTVGSIVALIIGVVGLFFFCRRYRRNATPNSSSEDILGGSPTPAAAWRPSYQEEEDDRQSRASDRRFYGGSLFAPAPTAFRRPSHDESVGQDFDFSRGVGQGSSSRGDDVMASYNPGILASSSTSGIEQRMEEGGFVLPPTDRSAASSPPGYAGGGISKGSLVSFDRDPFRTPLSGSTEAIAGGGESQVSSGEPLSLTRPPLSGARSQPLIRPQPRRYSSSPANFNRGDEPHIDNNPSVSEFGEAQLSQETRTASAGSLRALWHRLSSARRSTQSGVPTLKAPSSSHVHNPFGSVESLDLPPALLVAPPSTSSLSRMASPSSLLNPPPPSMAPTSAPSTLPPPNSTTSTSNPLAKIPILRFPRRSHDTHVSQPFALGSNIASGSGGGAAGSSSGGLSVPQPPWPTFNLPPSPALTTQTLEDDNPSIRAEGLLHPRLFNSVVSSQQPSMTSLGDHLDYSRPLGTRLANAIPGSVDRSFSTSTTDTRPEIAVTATATAAAAAASSAFVPTHAHALAGSEAPGLSF